jgi:erythromycin esterase-like protein
LISTADGCSRIRGSLPRVILLFAMLGLLLLPAPAWAQQADLGSLVAHVADAVCGKQVVILGELPSHGEARAFEAKAKIVQRLIDRCGFDAVLFEAPIYDFVGFQEGGEQHRAVAAQLDRAIGRFWWTRELTDWRRWLFRRATERGLVLGGLDDQVSVTSDYARATLPSLVAASSPPQGASACEQTVARHLFWRYDASTPFDEPEQIRLQRCVREAADALAVRAEGDRRTAEEAMLENLANYVDRQRRAPAARDRDEAMYRNALWHIERMPAASKVIIWTATVHASRKQGRLPQQPLGARLAAQRGRSLASVGFTAFAGWSSMAGQPRKQLPQAPPGSLEAQATEGNAPWVFLNAAALRRIGHAPSRLLGSFTEADWSGYFDGVVVIREEVAPVFDPWK